MISPAAASALLLFRFFVTLWGGGRSVKENASLAERWQGVVVTHAHDLYINPLWAKIQLRSIASGALCCLLNCRLEGFSELLSSLGEGGGVFASTNPLSCLFFLLFPLPVCLLFFPPYYSFCFFIRPRPVEHKLRCEWHLCKNQLECWRFAAGLPVLCGL